MQSAKFLGAAAALALGLGTMPLRAEGPTADTVVATVNGKAITLGHMIVLRDQLPPQYQALPDDVLFSGILDQLIQQSALEQATEGSLSRRDRLALENERRGYVAGVALRAVMAGAVTEDALQAAYDARFKDAAPATEYNASHILVDSEEKAADLKAQIEAGADFATLAREHSTDPGSGARGGDLGWFGLGQMVQPFEAAVVALKPGQIGGPVQTQFGWHIVRLNETRLASVPTFEQVREELAAELERRAVDAHIAELTARAEITRPGEGIDPAALRDLSLLDD
jgi:peptidyl-prolyl cis-trans isomerase C